jgi:hypothetical protein
VTHSVLYRAHTHAIHLLIWRSAGFIAQRSWVSSTSDKLLDWTGRGLHLSFLHMTCFVHSRKFFWLSKYTTKVWEEIYRQKKVKITTGLNNGRSLSSVGRKGGSCGYSGKAEIWIKLGARASGPVFSISVLLIVNCYLFFAAQASTLRLLSKFSSTILLDSAIWESYSHSVWTRIEIGLGTPTVNFK